MDGWILIHNYMDVCTYHDGEGGGVHRRSEDDAEDADNHGSLLVGVGSQKHGEHHDHHEHGLNSKQTEHPQLHAGAQHGLDRSN